ncbi:MAG: hypothetical protein HDQ88_12265 [Clostridia bacterium]|nr:hypothetical protein [Clostridia bacterium]
MWNLNKPKLQNSLDDLTEIEKHSRSLNTTHLPSIQALYDLYNRQNGSVSEAQHNGICTDAQKGLRTGYDKTTGKGIHSNIRADLKKDVDKCPMCSVGNADTLDHYMEKDKYKALSMMRQNLVPMCYHCNTTRNHTGLQHTDFIHAYYDNLPKDRQWLKVKVTYAAGAIYAQFYVDSTILTDPTLRRKASRTIDGLELNRTIGKEIQSFLKSTLSCGKQSNLLLKITLQNEARKHMEDPYFGKNHWKSVLLSYLAEDPTISIDKLSLYL